MAELKKYRSDLDKAINWTHGSEVDEKTRATLLRALEYCKMVALEDIEKAERYKRKGQRFSKAEELELISLLKKTTPPNNYEEQKALLSALSIKFFRTTKAMKKKAIALGFEKTIYCWSAPVELRETAKLIEKNIDYYAARAGRIEKVRRETEAGWDFSSDSFSLKKCGACGSSRTRDCKNGKTVCERCRWSPEDKQFIREKVM